MCGVRERSRRTERMKVPLMSLTSSSSPAPRKGMREDQQQNGARAVIKSDSSQRHNERSLLNLILMPNATSFVFLNILNTIIISICLSFSFSSFFLSLLLLHFLSSELPFFSSSLNLILMPNAMSFAFLNNLNIAIISVCFLSSFIPLSSPISFFM